MSDEARIVLVETSPHLPGLLPFPAWDAMATATRVFVRDREAHPHANHLYFAGIDVDELEPAELGEQRMDLLQPGSPSERRLARGLVEAAEESGDAVYVLGPGDEEFGRLVGLDAAKRGGLEVEFVFLPPLPTGAELLRLVDVEAHLRDPDDGCPWDLEQDHESLVHYLIEETYELVDAIEHGTDDDLREELGDLLLQIVFHAQIAADREAFTIDDVAAGITDKLVHRHPHVFGDAEVTDAAEVKENWETIKRTEKQRSGPFDGMPRSLPAVMLAWELQRKAAKLGFEWGDADGPADKVREELDETLAADSADRAEAEIGDLLNAVIALARQVEVDPETALRKAATRFRDRFERALDLLSGRSPDELTDPEWLDLWERAADAG